MTRASRRAPGRAAQRGAVAVELALLAVPLLMILFGITEFGRAMVEYNTLTKAARDAARLLSTQTPSDPDYPTLVENARCFAIYGNATCSGSPLLPGLTNSMFTYCDRLACAATHAAQGAAPVMNLVTVTIGTANNPYAFVSVAPFGVASFNFAPIQVTMWQVL